MKIIGLQERRLVEDLEQVAAQQNTTAETLLNRAVSQFLYKMALQKMQAETAAFEQMHDQLIQNFLGKYVAIHNGQLVDHDPELTHLRSRIRQRFGRMPILLRQVTSERDLRELKFRSPRMSSVSNEP
jgi:uncharacterized protein YfaT (DUF1175 family)